MFSEQREKTLTALICCCHVRHSIALIALHDEAVVKARSQKHLKDPILSQRSQSLKWRWHYFRTDAGLGPSLVTYPALWIAVAGSS